jgi:hypothetical protein
LYRRLGQNYLNKESETIFVKRSFKKDFRIIFLEEKVGFKRNYLKKTEARLRCDWASALGKMGHGAGSVQEGETR